MKAYAIATIIAFAAIPAVAQQQQSTVCPDNSQALALGIQAYNQRDMFINRSQQLDAQVTELRKMLADSDAKVKADDELIKSLRDEKTTKPTPPSP